MYEPGIISSTVLSASADTVSKNSGVALKAPGAPFFSAQQADTPRTYFSVGNTVVQRKDVDMGAHGQVKIPDDNRWNNLTPDVAFYSNPSAVSGCTHNEPAGKSMEILLSPNHGMGGSPNALNKVFELIPTKGDFKISHNKHHQAGGTNMYIKGHLLNDNLGGPGTDYNLYPITHQANMDHSNMVEEPLKTHVNGKGGVAYYKVSVDEKGTKKTGMYDSSGKKELEAPECDFNTQTVIIEKKTDNLKTSNKTIRSRWKSNATDYGTNALLEPPDAVFAPKFDSSLVKHAPRKNRDKIFDDMIIEVALYLAGQQKVSGNDWYRTIKGIGEKGANLLKTGQDYTGLSKGDKTTFSKSFGLLKETIEIRHLELYKRAQVIQKEIDDGVSELDLDDPQELIKAADALIKVEKSIDQITSGFSSLSLGSDNSMNSSFKSVYPFSGDQYFSKSFTSNKPESKEDKMLLENEDFGSYKFGESGFFSTSSVIKDEMDIPEDYVFGSKSGEKLLSFEDLVSTNSFGNFGFNFGPTEAQQNLKKEIQGHVKALQEKKEQINYKEEKAEEYALLLEKLISILQSIGTNLDKFMKEKDNELLQEALTWNNFLGNFGWALKSDLKSAFS